MSLNILPIYTLLANATAENPEYNSLIQKTITILQTCETNQISTLLLAGDYDDFFQKSLVNNIPVALIAESKLDAFEFYTLTRYFFTMFKQFSSYHLFHKLTQFVVVSQSQPMLRLLLQRIRDSTWANFTGFYILIDRKTENGCANAYRFLWVAWEYDLLSSIFFCADPVEGLLIYTYNPYSNIVPSEWQDAGRFKGRKGHPWLLMKRKYQDGPNICKNLTFDKTTDLNGYEVRLNAVSFMPHLGVDLNKSGLDKFSGGNGEIMKMVFRKLNASMNVIVNNGTIYDLGGVDSHGYPVGMLADLDTGRVDIGMNARNLYAMWKLGHTYPHDQDGVCVITQRAGEKSELLKVLSFMSPSVRLTNAIIILIALCLLTKQKGFVPAILDVIRMITSATMHRFPQGSACRIFFISVLVLIVIMNSLLLSHWSSLLTVPVPRPNIKTLEDLKKSNNTIYGSTFYAHLFKNQVVLKSRFQAVSYDECKQRVRLSRNAACLDDCFHLYVRIRSDIETFTRSAPLQQHLQVYVTRENWSLLTPVTKLIQIAVEAGIVVMWKKLNMLTMYRAWKRRLAREYRSYRTLRIKHVSFCFYLIAIGYCLATVVFVLEILVTRYRSRMRKIFKKT
nr:PREDICTED: uncharacterized protein LOC105662194 [Megachile rotundata]